MGFDKDFDHRTYEMLKAHAPDAAEKYKDEYDAYIANLPHFPPVSEQVEVVTTSEDKNTSQTQKVDDSKPVSEGIEQGASEAVDLIALQKEYEEKTGKKLSPAVRNNAEWIKNKLSELV